MFYRRCLAAFALAALLLLPACADKEDPGSSDGKIPSPPPSPACSATFSEEDTLPFRTEGYELQASCDCGRPLLFVSLDPEVLSVEGDVARTKELGGATLAVFHADASGYATHELRVTQGKSEAIAQPRVVLKYGETLSEKLEIGVYVVDQSALDSLAVGEINRVEVTANLDSRRAEADSDEGLRFKDSPPYVAEVDFRRADAVAPEPRDWSFSDDYRTGMTLADFAFSEEAAHYFWDAPETLLFPAETPQFFAAWYTPRAGFVDNFKLEIPVTVTPGLPVAVEPPALAPVDFDELLRLSAVSLPDGFVWRDGETLPEVDNAEYAAVYSPNAYFRPFELTIPLEVRPKRGEAIEFPKVKDDVFELYRRANRFISDQLGDKFFFEEDFDLHAGNYELELCYRLSENYEIQRQTVRFVIRKAARGKPKPPQIELRNGVYVVRPAYDDPEPDLLEYRETETAAFGPAPASYPPDLPLLWYRYRETEDFEAGEIGLWIRKK